MDRIPISVRVPEDLYKEVRKIAIDRNDNVTAIVIRAFMKYVEKEEQIKERLLTAWKKQDKEALANNVFNKNHPGNYVRGTKVFTYDIVVFYDEEIDAIDTTVVERGESVSESGKIWELYRQKMGNYNYNYIFKKMMKEIEKNLPESKSS